MPELDHPCSAMEKSGGGGGGGGRRQQPMVVQLQPFIHQVGGMSSVLCFDDTTLCKPLVQREQCFYETMPPEMRLFAPEYRGVVEVSAEEDEDGVMKLLAHPCWETLEKLGLLGCNDPTRSDCDRPPSSGQVRYDGSKSIEKSYPFQAKSVSWHLRPKTSVRKVVPHNPWGQQCIERQVAKMRKNCGLSQVGRHDFMLLENLATHFRNPCVLDIKMGTRTDGPGHTEKKKLICQERCRTTTSARLGFRICGMQVYQANTGQYIFHDKYVGRSLTQEGVVEELRQYLHNGCSLRTDIVDLILQKLEDLHAMVSHQNTFRFFSSSLLVMYEGGDSAPEHPSPAPIGKDQSYHEHASDCDVSCDKSGSAPDDKADLNDNNNDEMESNNQQHEGSSNNKGPLVEVRMIDFAHGTHQDIGLGDECVHRGPDMGYIFGLKSLIRLFQTVAADGSISE